MTEVTPGGGGTVANNLAALGTGRVAVLGVRGDAYLEAKTLGQGIPFMAPLANRIDQDYYYIEGKKYLLNESLGNLLRVPPKTTSCTACWSTSRAGKS